MGESKNKKVVVITTGGTIAMSEDAMTKTVKPEGDNVLASYIPYLNNIADIEMLDFFNLPSPHIKPEHMHKLAMKVKYYLDQEEYAGVVITHGTDTLEETAYFLDLVVESEKPIVVTGAMRSNNELGSDGPINLISSVRVASSKTARNKGVLVVFNDEIHAARHVTKTHTSNVATFQSPSFGPIGTVTKKEILFQQSLLKHEHMNIDTLDKDVWLFKAYAGMDSRMIEYSVEQKVDGIVIEALGQGNVPPALVDGIKKAIGRNIPVVLVSRCFNGIVEDIYGYEGGGKQLKELGAIFSNGLNGQKARIKLMILLSCKSNMDMIQSSFEE